MNINFSWKFHQKVLTLTVYFIVLNDSIEFVLIYCPHPVHFQQTTYVTFPVQKWFLLKFCHNCYLVKKKHRKCNPVEGICKELALMEVRSVDQGETDQREKQQPDIFISIFYITNKVSLLRIGYLQAQKTSL